MSGEQEHNLAKVRYVVAVAAGKGGVGKSTLAVNLALCLKRKGYRVGLMDADLYGPSLRKMLPDHILPSQHPDIQERIIPAETHGIRCISMAHFLAHDAPASVRAPIANGIIKQFIHLVDWGELDFLLIDFPPGTGDIQLTLIQEGALSGAVVVTTPQEIALLDVRKATEMLRQMQVPLIGVVENMSYFLTPERQKVFPFGEGGGKRFAAQNGLFFLGQIPIEAAISRCSDGGKSLFEEEIEIEAAQAFAEISEQVRQQLDAFEKLNGTPLKNFDLQWK